MRWPDRRIVAVFEPRSNTTVTNRFQGPLTEAFAEADRVWIGPIYRADRIPEADQLDRVALCETLEQAGVPAGYADTIDALIEQLRASVQDGDVVLVLSNGAFGGLHERLRAVWG